MKEDALLRDSYLVVRVADRRGSSLAAHGWQVQWCFHLRGLVAYQQEMQAARATRGSKVSTRSKRASWKGLTVPVVRNSVGSRLTPTLPIAVTAVAWNPSGDKLIDVVIVQEQNHGPMLEWSPTE